MHGSLNSSSSATSVPVIIVKTFSTHSNPPKCFCNLKCLVVHVSPYFLSETIYCSVVYKFLPLEMNEFIPRYYDGYW